VGGDVHQSSIPPSSDDNNNKGKFPVVFDEACDEDGLVFVPHMRDKKR